MITCTAQQWGVWKKKYNNEEIQTHQVIYKIQNGMVQDIKVGGFIKCIKAHLTQYNQTQFKNHATGIAEVFKEKGTDHNTSDKEAWKAYGSHIANLH